MSNKTIADLARHYVACCVAVVQANSGTMLQCISDRDMAFAMLARELGMYDELNPDEER